MIVLAAVLTGPLLATCSTKENTACPFGATLGADRFALLLGEPDHQRGHAALLVEGETVRALRVLRQALNGGNE